MPELPEVETVRRGLEKRLIGRVLRTEVHDTPKGFPNTPGDVAQFMLGASVTAVKRRAKVLLIELSSAYTLVVHLKMTGQLVFVGYRLSAGHAETASRSVSSRVPTPHSTLAADVSEAPQTNATDQDTRFGAGHPNDSLVGVLPDRSTRVTITFTDESALFFNDQRKFGWMKLVPTVLVPELPFMQKVGPEPLETAFTSAIFWERLQRRKGTTIKAAILDQTVLAGVGNIYADEGLWGARIHPATRVKDVTRVQTDLLWSELRYVMNLAIEKGGSTNKNYVNVEGKRGSYMDFARVFRREGLPCPRHPDVLIEKIKVAGRGTHICPVCQPLA